MNNIDRCFRLGALLLTLSGCSLLSPPPSAGPSAETEFLEKQVRPQLVQWWDLEAAETLPLKPILGDRGYDELCLVPGENYLDKIETKERTISIYHSSSGMGVPDGSVALVAVRDGIAHAVVITQVDMLLSAQDGRLCRQPERSRITRKSYPGTRSTVAILGE